MNLKAYYQRIREVEHMLTEPFAILISQATPDGGKGGVPTEVPSSLAAKMIADGRARLADSEEARMFRQQLLEAKRAADDEATAGKVQVTIVPSPELKRPPKAPKE